MLRSILFHSTCYLLVRVLLGAVFLVSGILKAGDLEAFTGIVNAFAILPEAWAPFAALVICACEIIFGVALIMDVKGGLGGITAMLVVFILVLGYAIHLGYDIDCGCFGPQDPEAKAFSSLRTSLIRDVFMVAVAVYLYAWRVKHRHVPVFITHRFKGESKHEGDSK